MKKFFAGIVVVGVVIITSLAAFMLCPSLALKVSNLQKDPAQLAGNKPAEDIGRAGAVSDVAIPSPVTMEIVEPSEEEKSTPIIALEQLSTPQKNHDPGPEDMLPPQSETHSVVKADNHPAVVTDNKPTQGLGLLADTGETAENQILEPQSTQVQPAIQRRAQKNTGGYKVDKVVLRSRMPHM